MYTHTKTSSNTYIDAGHGTAWVCQSLAKKWELDKPLLLFVEELISIRLATPIRSSVGLCAMEKPRVNRNPGPWALVVLATQRLRPVACKPMREGGKKEKSQVSESKLNESELCSLAAPFFLYYHVVSLAVKERRPLCVVNTRIILAPR